MVASPAASWCQDSRLPDADDEAAHPAPPGAPSAANFALPARDARVPGVRSDPGDPSSRGSTVPASCPRPDRCIV